MIICWQDFETGGLEVAKHSPLSFAMVFTSGDKILSEWHTQIRQPPIVTTPEALAVNKIDPTTPGLSYVEFAKEYRVRLMSNGYRPIYAGHNCSFDRPFLRSIVGQDDGCHYHSIDTMVLANSLKAMGFVDWKSMSLSGLCKELGVEPEGELHNALTDAKAAFRCFLAMKARISFSGV